MVEEFRISCHVVDAFEEGEYHEARKATGERELTFFTPCSHDGQKAGNNAD